MLSVMLLFHIQQRENRNPFIPAVVTALKEGLSVHNITHYIWQVPNLHHILFWEHKQEL